METFLCILVYGIFGNCNFLGGYLCFFTFLSLRSLLVIAFWRRWEKFVGKFERMVESLFIVWLGKNQSSGRQQKTVLNIVNHLPVGYWQCNVDFPIISWLLMRLSLFWKKILVSMLHMLFLKWKWKYLSCMYGFGFYRYQKYGWSQTVIIITNAFLGRGIA